ncbi:hypothetical protein QJ850_gp392 [Acanthamoeba polyphaga mimivirus]|uniref:Uncharacterized protein n=1 Tax=Acanthamoeba polyphaga mimivirus Kroon TaxID=3069720 RepID=A0A0G2Y8Y6_9VIRU|nr:hypothetical protein QJ850_gp392 [Acanthamoeba polyphaga mimivirus]AKI80307.1 hypothetical protein [Acanthamoeba polyphaga mimivirus Kroon]
MDSSIISKIDYSEITSHTYGFYGFPFYLKRDKEDNIKYYQMHIFIYYENHEDHSVTDCDYTYCFVKDLTVNVYRDDLDNDDNDDNNENHSLLGVQITVSNSLKLTGIKNDTDGSIEFPQINNENPLILRDYESTIIKINLFGKLSDLVNYNVELKYSGGVIDKSTANYFDNNEFVCFDDFTFSNGTYLKNSDLIESEFYCEAVVVKGNRFNFYPYLGCHVFDIEYDFLDYNYNPIQFSNSSLEKLYFIKNNSKSNISNVCNYTEFNPLLVNKYYSGYYIGGLFNIFGKREIMFYVKFIVKKIDLD